MLSLVQNANEWSEVARVICSPNFERPCATTMVKIVAAAVKKFEVPQALVSFLIDLNQPNLAQLMRDELSGEPEIINSIFPPGKAITPPPSETSVELGQRLQRDIDQYVFRLGEVKKEMADVEAECARLKSECDGLKKEIEDLHEQDRNLDNKIEHAKCPMSKEDLTRFYNEQIARLTEASNRMKTALEQKRQESAEPAPEAKGENPEPTDENPEASGPAPEATEQNPEPANPTAEATEENSLT